MIARLGGLALGVWLVASPCAAQDAPRALGTWASYGLQMRTAGSALALQTDAQVRTHRPARDFDQLLLRVGPQLTLPGSRVTLATGYVYGRSEAQGLPDSPTTEHRLYQEAGVRYAAGAFRLSHRLRLEERWVGGRTVQSRARVSLGATAPLARGGDVFAAASAETFVRGPDGDAETRWPAYDRTRLFGGVGFRVGGPVTVQAGYLAQVLRDRVDHQLQVSVQHAVTL